MLAVKSTHWQFFWVTDCKTSIGHTSWREVHNSYFWHKLFQYQGSKVHSVNSRMIPLTMDCLVVQPPPIYQWSVLYVKYLQVYAKLEDCYDQVSLHAGKLMQGRENLFWAICVSRNKFGFSLQNLWVTEEGSKISPSFRPSFSPVFSFVWWIAADSPPSEAPWCQEVPGSMHWPHIGSQICKMASG